jgi:hypothetical protein
MNIANLSTLRNSHNIWFAGQSNCGGFNHPSPPDPATYPVSPGQYIFEPVSQTWQQLQQNKNNSGCPFGFLGFFGSELKLMELLKDHYGSDQYMMKYAQGGTSLSTLTADEYNWSPSSTTAFMFKRFVDSYLTAMDNFPAAKIYPKVLIWWQGEDDTSTADADAYAVNFNNFISALKNQCFLPNLKVIQVGLSNNQTAYSDPGKAAVNAAKMDFAIHGNKFVNTNGADVQAGGVHFSSVGYEDIAERIFNVLITML